MVPGGGSGRGLLAHPPGSSSVWSPEELRLWSAPPDGAAQCRLSRPASWPTTEDWEPLRQPRVSLEACCARPLQWGKGTMEDREPLCQPRVSLEACCAHPLQWGKGTTEDREPLRQPRVSLEACCARPLQWRKEA
ncbi:UNVERIFIED_CONTAM: hypothetical protein K2H54_040723 [Gekko kuhli]